jgi:hypothetical protein
MSAKACRYLELFSYTKSGSGQMCMCLFLSLLGIVFGLYPKLTYAGQKVNLSQSAASFIGEAKYDNSAFRLAFAGDVNGDGFDDFLIGAHNNDDGGENAGKCYLILGKSQGWRKDLNLSQADVCFIGEADNDNAGISVSYAGDVNGDGYDDFIIGAHNNDDSGEDAGKCYLFFGRQNWKNKINLNEANVVLTGQKDKENAGLALAYAGDVNGDGYDDFLIGAHGFGGSSGSSGQCYLILGRKNWASELRLYYADASFIGEDMNDRLGAALAYAGDVNGDGYDDFLIGAPSNDYAGEDSGQIYLFLGRREGWQKNTPASMASASFIGENAKDNAGISLSYAGDINGDGFADILIGADSNSEAGDKAGKCYLLLGRAEAWSMRTPLSLADAAILGEEARAHLGIAVSYAGDTNGDGLDDFILAASRSNEGNLSKVGKSYLFCGRAEGLKKLLSPSEADLTLVGEGKNDFSGNTLSYAGDVNGDGVGDILIGADANSEGGRSAGQTYLIFNRLNSSPGKISKVKLMSDKSYNKELKTEVKNGDMLYIQLEGEDSDPSCVNVAQVITNTSNSNHIRLGLIESSQDSGIFRGSMKLVNTSSSRFGRRLRITPGETIVILAKDDRKKYALVSQQVSLDAYEIDDDQNGLSFGNNNGHIEAGETIELSLRLANNYFERVSVTARLTSDDPYLKLTRPVSSFGTILSRHTQAGANSFVLQVADDCPDQHLLKLSLIIADESGLSWNDSLSLMVARLVTISGKVRDKYTNQVIGGARITYGEQMAASGADGAYAIYFNKSAHQEHLMFSAPDYLKVAREVMLDRDQQLDISLPPRLDLSRVPVSFVGEEQRDASGYAVAYAGDVNGDGFGDFLIGAWGSDEGGTDAGQTYLILGRSQGWQRGIDLSKADASFIGENPFDESGRTLAYAGDVNGDGFDDFLIGAPGNDKGGDKAGQTYLILGHSWGWRLGVSLAQSSASFIGEAAHDQAGLAISYAGDVNGDNFDDFLIGAWASDTPDDDAGQVYLLFGKSQGWQMYTPLTHADVSFIGENARDELGKAVSYAGDVNGDGYDDFLIGAPSNSTEKSYAGKSYLIFGAPYGLGWRMTLTNMVSFIGEGSNDASGSHLSYAGDVNGDGYSDFLIGAWSNDEGGGNAGQTYLFLGKASGWKKEQNLSEASASFIGEQEDDAAGLSATYAGDVNGDGYDDFLIGAWGSQLDQSNQGQSYLILGKSSGWSMDTQLSYADFAFLGRGPADAAGKALAFAGDVNGDGYDDFLIGAWGNDQWGEDAGETYLIWLDKNSPPRKIDSLEMAPMASKDNIGRQLSVRLVGEDADPQKINVAQVLLESPADYVNDIKLRLIETAPDSGEFFGRVKLSSTSSSQWANRLLAYGNEIITVSALSDGLMTREIRVKDTHPPFVSQQYPKPDEQRAPVSSPVLLNILDPGTGVDKSSISLQVNQQPVSFEISGEKNNYQLIYHPSGVFDFGEMVQVGVKAADLADPSNFMEEIYSFKTADKGVIDNPGFEEEFTDWNYQPVSGVVSPIDPIVGATTAIDPTVSKSGLASCKVEFTGERDVAYRDLFQGPILVQPNTDYLLMGYVKTENLSSRNGIRLYVEGSNMPYKVSDPSKYFNAQSSELLGTNDWTLLYVPFTTKVDSRYLFVYLVRWDGGGAISGTCWLDDVYLMVASEPGFGFKRFKARLIEYFR